MPDPVATPEQTVPPQGGAIGSAGPASVSPAAGASPSAPTQLSFTQLLEKNQSAATPTPPAGETTPAPIPSASVTVESLQAELAAARAARIPDEELQQLREFAQIGFNKWRQDQIQPQVPAPQQVTPTAPAQPKSITGVEPFDPNLKMFLSEDPVTGEVKETVGAPPGTLAAWHRHTRSKAEFFNKFAQDPAQFGFVTKEEAQRLAQEEFNRLSQTTNNQLTGKQILEQNKKWIYQLDDKENVKRDFLTNQPKLTPNGEMYLGFVEQLYADGRGITDPSQLNKMASQMLIGHLFQQQQMAGKTNTPAPVSTVPQKSPEDAARELLLQQAARTAAGAPITGIVPGAQPQPQTRLTFADMFRKNAGANGVTV